MNPLTEQLRAYIESHYPALYLVTHENEQADALIRELCQGRKIIEWNLAQGLVDFDNKQPYSDYQNLETALAWMRAQDIVNPVFVLKDAQMAWKDNPLALARLKNLIEQGLRQDEQQQTVFIVSHELHIPSILEKFITVFDLPLPDEASIRRHIESFAQDLGETVADEVLTGLSFAFQGLTHYETQQLLHRSYQQDGQLTLDDLQLIHDEKAQIIKKSGTLEVVNVSEKLADIGGLNLLKPWLKQKGQVMNNWTSARAFGVEPPKGMMIVGMPGCGKSLTAKAASKLFNLPLLKLDMGSLMGKYVGESESNMRHALKVAEAVSPCVLWMDEVEKAFAGLHGQNAEVATRMFGYFLSWMQDKTSQVFVIATANDISALPPELLRKGRFDEIFYVDFPNESERKAIFEVHLRKRNQLHDDIKLDELVKATKDYSGADIEAVVKESIEKAFIDKAKQLDTSRLLTTIKSTQPLGEVMKDKVNEYKAKFEKMKIKKAS
jgi:SpoVK/Ycf46/Vps4 family AAA+-type ATPase